MRPELIGWFEAQRVPRYTSYPTAPHFTAAIGAPEHAGWLRGLRADEPVSLYLHIPFCRQLCWYCGCNTTITQDQARLAAYVGWLEREIDLVVAGLPGPLPVTHLHWGGGTPSSVGIAGLGRLMRRVRERLDLRPEAEIAIELDPRVVDDALLDMLAGTGVNRVSIGVQSFDPAVQAAINRFQSLELTAGVIDGLRRRGIGAINIDMLYGLPRQTVSSAVESARLVAGLDPDRVAVFGYAHVPGFKKHQRVIDTASLPDAAARVAQYEAMGGTLAAAGYATIGLDHFARPDDPLARAARAGRLRRNFQGYSTDAATTLLGLGCSSISTFADGYVQNHADLRAWREALAAGRLPTARGVALSPDDRLRREAIEAIMCRGEVDLAVLAARHGVPPAACEPDPERFALVERLGIASRDGSLIRVAADCRPLLRVVAAAFDRYLQPEGGRHAAAV